MHDTHSVRRQKGATLVFVALWMGIALAGLMVLDIGNLFWQKRELQKIADLSALAGAVKPLDGACTSVPPSNANLIAKANGMQVADVFEAKHGRWTPAAGMRQEQFFTEGAGSTSNACHVEIQRSVAYFFILPAGGNQGRRIGAKATALVSSDPLATVLIRSSLASVNAGVLNALLSGVIGSQVGLNAVSWQGIAKLNINLLKVADALIAGDVALGSYEQLLDSQVSLSNLLRAMVTAVEPGRFVSADLEGLRQLSLLNFGNVNVRLGDLIQLENTSPSAALNLGVSALDLVQGALQVANKNNALALNLGVPGLLKVKLKVIEPAQIAIIANPLDKLVTIEARTAQIRLWIGLGTTSSPVGSVVTSVVGLVVDLLKAVLGILVNVEILPEFRNLNALNLDVLLDVARGYVRVEDADCISAPHTMDLKVEKAGVDLYLGQIAGSSLEQREQNAFGSRIPQVQPLTIIDVGSRVCAVLGLICGPRTEGSQGNIRLGGHLKVLAQSKNVQFSGVQLNSFVAEENAASERIYHKVVPESIQTISGLLQGANLIEINLGSGSGGTQRVSLINSLLETVLKPVLAILDPLGPLLDGLLAALGIQLNAIEVAPYLQCQNRSELVY